jgi:serine/threonine protein kinase
MPSESVAGFLDHAQASRVLFPEQVEQLIRQPDIPQSDLASLCTYLLSRGVLTRYQADALREGRGHELSFAGYPLLDVIGPCRGGTAYQSLHPSLRTPLVVRRFAPGGFAPTDDASLVVQRARGLGTIPHPNLLPLLDAGVYQGQPYAVLDQPTDATDLASMMKEVGGAMPGFLAAEYGWAVASALRSIHERGGWHGEVRPGLLLVGPILTKTNPDGSLRRRPAPNASVRLTETGLVPVTPPAAASPPPAEVLAFLPPERIDGNEYGPRGDTYGLGATLYSLLAGRPPFEAGSPEELLGKVRSSEPTPLAALRRDIPADFAALVMRMMAKRPEDRPQTAFDVCQALAPFCRPGTLPPMPAPAPLPALHAVPLPAGGVPQVVPHAVPHAVLHAQPVPVAEAEPEPDAWGVDPNAFEEAHAAAASDPAPKRRRGLTDKEKGRAKIWIALGLCLHLTAVTMILGYFFGAFDGLFSSTPEKKSEPQQQQQQQQHQSPTKKPRGEKKQRPPKVED